MFGLVAIRPFGLVALLGAALALGPAPATAATYGATPGPARSPLFRWKGLFLTTRAEILTEARVLTNAGEIQHFRAMLAKRVGNPDVYLGGLLSMIETFAEREEFAARFGVEDPVFGTPAEMRDMSRTTKALLMRLGMRGMPLPDLKLVRAARLRPTPGQMESLEIFLHVTRPPIDAATFFATWNEIALSCGHRMAQP